MLTAKLLLVYLLQTANVFGIEVDTSKIDLDEAYCLAQNIYYEAKSEDIQGQIAVAAVTVNRANDPRYPNSICEVVKQASVSTITKNTICAFSWYCEGNKKNGVPLKNKDGSVNQAHIDQFQVASMIAIAVLSGEIDDNTNGATHFHNPNISNPNWKNSMKRTVRLGNHDFYKK